MTAIRDSRTIAPGFGNAIEWYRLRYNFANDAGATGALDILTASGALVIVAAWATVRTTCTSGGSATVKWGVTGSDALFMNTTQGAVASLVALATILPPAVEGTPNVLPLPYKMASGDKCLMTIGAATLTAGVIEFVLGIVKP